MRDAGVIRVGAVRQGQFLLQLAGFIFYLLAVQSMMTLGMGLRAFFATRLASQLLLPAVSALLASSYVAIGFSLRRYRIWARNFAFAFAAVGLVAFPVGTGVGAVVLLCIVRANRARVFTSKPFAVSPVSVEEKPAVLSLIFPVPAEEEPAVLHFEPELVAEQAG